MKHYKQVFSSFLLSSVVLLFNGCSSKLNEPQTIQDLQQYKQQAQPYLKNIPTIEYSDQMQLDKAFNEQYFKPWHIQEVSLSLEEATWGHKYATKEVYGDNHKLIPQTWFNQQIDNANFEAYNSLRQKAITIQNSALRVFPSISKIFYNPNVAGEGFPFDYNQNSGIKINSPLLISHYSKDKAWAFVQSSFAAGWVQIQDIALVSETLAHKFESGNYYIAIKDNFPLYKNGIFKEYIKLGTLFPKTKSGKYLTINKDIHQNGFLSTVQLNESQIDKKPIKLNVHNVKQVFNELIGEPYGWGELLNHRDCSALTRDFIAPFGIYLGRNSASQIKNTQYIEVKELDGQRKKELLIQQGTPFLTLVYLKGHIMLYIGHDKGEPLVFHNIWGVKTLQGNQHNRFILGQAVVTTLEAGKELQYYDASQSLLEKMEGFSNFTQKTPNE